MSTRTVSCKECGWEGTEDVLDSYRCPKCGSRQLKTTGSRLSSDENRDPPEGAIEGEDWSQD